MKIVVVLSFVLGFVLQMAGQKVDVIPYPAEVCFQTGYFMKPVSGIIFENDVLLAEARFLREKWTAKSLKIKKGAGGKNGIFLALSDRVQSEEGYWLVVKPEGIRILGKDRAGVFYGIQTLLQLEEQAGGKGIPCCEIRDMPRYSWRGYMLDESRHFLGKVKVMQLLDRMAYYKLNKFHWHLTDEPGWRVEIKKYPLLATEGGKGCWSRPAEDQAHYYTQQEIREIVAYAAQRHIEVIPEIDMPGHATAANRAYPQYSGGGTAEHPDFTFNVGKEETYVFLSDVLREITTLFPSSYLHLGGDEVAFGSKAWETNPEIQALMKRENLNTLKMAEKYFMNRMSDTVRQLGKMLVGWDELLQLNTDKMHTLIMWWRHDKPVILKRALEKGYQVVMCPRRPLYFDFIQHSAHKWGRVWDGFCPLEDVYTFPDKGFMLGELTSQERELIKGIQANLWTERVQNEKRLDFMTFPRLLALSEAAWTGPRQKDFEDFCRRLKTNYKTLDRFGLYYFDPFDPQRHPEPEGCKQGKKKIPMDFKD